ncbi:MAG: phosphatase PAP2 family protein [Candidatus Cyclobacteriaceae bacterium M2_1C_046]
MFDTAVNHWLQSFDNEFVYWLLNIVSVVGFVPFLLLIVLIILSGINFRYGIIIINFLGWTVLLTLLLKEAIGHPRPFEVDDTLKNLLFLPEGLVDLIKDQEYGTSGFPSGHVAFQTSIWAGMALLINKKRLWFLAALIILLTMISRLYLAHHYLGDVLAGLIVGVVVTVILYEIILKLKILEAREVKKREIIFLLIPVVLIFFLPYMPVVQLGRFIGFNIAFIGIFYTWGYPQLYSAFKKRILNTLLFLIIYFIFFYFYINLPPVEGDFAILVLNIWFNAVPLLIAGLIAKELHLFKPE